MLFCGQCWERLAKGHLSATGSETEAEKELDQEEEPGRNIHAKHGSPMKERWAEGSQKQGPPSPDLWRPTKLAMKCLYFKDSLHMGSCDRCLASLAASHP